MKALRPFFSYYGAKWRLARLYPRPMFELLKEPFAGSACYALHYPDRRVELCDSDPIIAGLWRYLIAARESEILSLPVLCESVDDLASTWPQEARWLVGFWLIRAGTMPNRTASLWSRRHRGERRGRHNYWGLEVRARIAQQLAAIRHWKIIEGDFQSLRGGRATWFIDPPYHGRPGSHYRRGSQGIDYEALATWCRRRCGQTIVCEAQGAAWLPFEPLTITKSCVKRYSREAVWSNGALLPRQLDLAMKV